MLFENYKPYELKHFTVNTLKVESEALKKNPLKDTNIKLNALIKPVEKGEYNLVFVLSGFTSSGQKSFNFKAFDKSLVQEIDEWTEDGAISPKVYVFVNAMTSWGGSQFVNSNGCGDYEDYIVKELLPFVTNELNKIGYKIKDNVLLGGSSGGYGALHLSSKYPNVFKHCLSIAPDSDFELSLKHEIYQALPSIEDHGGALSFYEKLKKNEINTNHKSFHTVVNVLAMAACYSDVDQSSMPKLPLTPDGEFDHKLWEKWLSHDPVLFLNQRIENVKKLKTIFLSVGVFDQFLLQFGSRKIKKIFDENQIDFLYEEFRGNHFDIGTRRKKALSLIE